VNGAAEGAPVEGMSKVRHPLLLEAVLRFQANARSEMLPTDGPVKIRDDGNDGSTQKDALAEALEKDANHYLTTVASEYYPDTDRMLLMQGFGGSAFKKIYFCPLKNRPVSLTVDAKDLIVNNDATDLQNAKRITHRIMMRPSTVKRLQILGVYRDLELPTPNAPKLNSVDRAEKEQQGLSASTPNPEDRDREIYECYCELDLKGFEHKFKGKVTGLEIPYRVTIDVSTRHILSIVRNYNEDTADLPEARQVFIKYPFVPGLGFYDIGLLHILGNPTNAVTAAWREMLDNGMYANFPGFLMAKQAGRQNTNLIRVPPGGGQQIDTQGMKIGDAVMALPYGTQHMPALMSLVQDIVQTGQRVGGTAESPVGEGTANVPVGTILALIEQATQILNAVHKRSHTSQAQEFGLLFDCFREHPESFWQRKGRSNHPWDEATFLTALDQYELVPQSDPNTASHTQRLMKAAALKQAASASPQLYDQMAVEKVVIQSLGFSNPEQFLLPPERQQPPPQVLKGLADAKVDQQRADADTLRAQAGAAETKAKIESGAFAPKGGLGAAGPQQPDPMDVAKLQLDQQRLTADRQEDTLEAQNRERDRESAERIAAADLVKDLIAHPESLPLAERLMGPDLLHNLESNEPSVLDGVGEGEPE
jgi:hypothetical protein